MLRGRRGPACRCHGTCAPGAEFLSPNSRASWHGAFRTRRWQLGGERMGGSPGSIHADPGIETSAETGYRHRRSAPPHVRSEMTAGAPTFSRSPKRESPWWCGPSLVVKSDRPGVGSRHLGAVLPWANYLTSLSQGKRDEKHLAVWGNKG